MDGDTQIEKVTTGQMTWKECKADISETTSVTDKSDDSLKCQNEQTNYTNFVETDGGCEKIQSDESMLQPDELLIYKTEQSLKLNKNIEERMRALQKTMVVLKQELVEEKELWRKEVDDMLEQESYEENMSECTSSMTDMSLIGSTVTLSSEHPSLTELTIFEYEQKLARYQEALAAAQAEKRATYRRQMAAYAYRRKLLEVENMCNTELIRVRESMQSLQPLQAIASEWSISSQEQNSMLMETMQNEDEEITGSRIHLVEPACPNMKALVVEGTGDN